MSDVIRRALVAAGLQEPIGGTEFGNWLDSCLGLIEEKTDFGGILPGFTFKPEEEALEIEWAFPARFVWLRFQSPQTIVAVVETSTTGERSANSQLSPEGLADMLHEFRDGR